MNLRTSTIGQLPTTCAQHCRLWRVKLDHCSIKTRAASFVSLSLEYGTHRSWLLQSATILSIAAANCVELIEPPKHQDWSDGVLEQWLPNFPTLQYSITPTNLLKIRGDSLQVPHPPVRGSFPFRPQDRKTDRR